MKCIRCKDGAQACLGGLGCEMMRFGQVMLQRREMEPNLYNPKQQGREEALTECIGILEEEMERGRSLLGLLDQAGRPVFDDKTTLACLEAIQYCQKRIKELRAKPHQC